MARLSHVPIAFGRDARSPDSLADLTRMLSRLQQTILHADAERERRLRTSEYERNKVGINLEYARTLLTRLEQEALSVKVHSRRQELQVDLNRKRDVFEQISERLRELDDMDNGDEDEDSSEGEDILGDIIQTPSESQDSRSTDLPTDGTAHSGEDMEDNDEEEERETPQSAAEPIPQPPLVQATPTLAPVTSSSPSAQPNTTTSNQLRSRAKAPGQKQDTAESTGRSKLFGDRTTELSTTATTEAILDHQRQEQDKLTESLVSMASALKSSSLAFQTSLDEEKDVLNQAGKGLDKNELGLEAASRRMGTLRKMSEGKGWWGRIMLYAWIFGLMVVATLIVFVLPKLRF